jgi:transcriptional regulator with XRE-family HTH domain
MERGLSQEALAHDAGIDRSYLGGIERGEHNVAIVNLLKLMDELDMTLAELMQIAKL